jgi:hypothetical protein
MVFFQCLLLSLHFCVHLLQPVLWEAVVGRWVNNYSLGTNGRVSACLPILRIHFQGKYLDLPEPVLLFSKMRINIICCRVKKQNLCKALNCIPNWNQCSANNITNYFPHSFLASKCWSFAFIAFFPATLVCDLSCFKALLSRVFSAHSAQTTSFQALSPPIPNRF